MAVSSPDFVACSKLRDSRVPRFNARQPEVDFLQYLGRDFDQIFGQNVSMREKTHRETNLEASCHIERKNSLPVGVRRSKTSLLKLPSRTRKYIGRKLGRGSASTHGYIFALSLLSESLEKATDFAPFISRL